MKLKQRNICNLTFGVFNKSWRGNQDGEFVVEIGNPDFSNVAELTLTVGSNSIADPNGEVIFRFNDQVDMLRLEFVFKLKSFIESHFQISMNESRLVESLEVHLHYKEWNDLKMEGVWFVTSEGPEINDPRRLRLLKSMYIHSQAVSDEDQEDIVTAMKV